MALVAAVVYLALAFTPNAYAAGSAGLIALVNPYVMQQLPNPLGLWVIAILGLVSGLIVRVAKGRELSSVLLVLTSLLASYLALNPPLLVLVIVWSLVLVALGSVIGGEGGRRRALMFVLRAAPWCFVVNLWWILPFVATLFGGPGQSVAAETDVEAWSWTHQRNSIPNVLSLNTSWGWEEPRYYPYAEALDRAPFGLFRYALPFAAFASVFIAERSRRRIAVTLALVAGGLVFLSKGLHEPLRGLNLFFYENVPGMWLLREPASKLGAALVIVYAVLICLGISGAAQAFQGPSRGMKATALLVPALLVWALIYPRPLWNGEVIADDRPGLPSEHVTVPDEWRQVAAGINSSESEGKVLVLPLNDYYQIPTTWGYYGTDVVPSRLLERPTVQLRPGGYFAELPAFENIIKTIQGDLLSGDTDEITRYLQSLGISHVVLRRDIDFDFPKREIASPAQINVGLKRVPGLQLADRSPVASVYELTEEKGMISAYGTLAGAPDSDPVMLPAVIEHQPPDSVVTTDGSARLGTVGRISEGASPTTQFQSGHGEYEIESTRSSAAFFQVRPAFKKGFGVLISSAMSLSLDGKPLASETTTRVSLPGVARYAVSGSQMRELVDRPIMSAPLDGWVNFFSRDSGSPSNAGFSEVQDCLQSDDRTLREVGIRATSIDSGSGVRLEARAHRACVYTSSKVQPNTPYEVTLSARSLSGQDARVCIWLEGPDRCSFVKSFSSSGDQSITHQLLPVPGTRALRVFLYADAERGNGKTVSSYRNVTISPLKKLQAWKVQAPDRLQESRELTAGEHELKINLPPPPSFGPLGEVSDCNAHDDRTIDEVGIAASELPGEEQPAVQLSAEAHSACITTAISPTLPGVPHMLELEYRSVSGNAPKICLWEEGPNRCVQAPPLVDGEDWTSLRMAFVPAAATREMKLFLYADTGSDEEPTVVEYRDLSVRLSAPYEATIASAKNQVRSAPDIAWTRTGPSSYEVQVEDVDHSFVLGLAESFSPRWQLTDMAEGRSSSHIEIDGHSNGWVIERGEAMTVSIEYAPDRTLTLASTASLLSIIALLLGLVATRGRRLSTTRPALVAREKTTGWLRDANRRRKRLRRKRDIWSRPPE